MDCEFLLRVDDNGEGRIAEDLALQLVRRGEELRCRGAEKRVGVTVAFAGCVVAASDELRACGGERSDSLIELLAASGGEQRLRRRAR